MESGNDFRETETGIDCKRWRLQTANEGLPSGILPHASIGGNGAKLSGLTRVDARDLAETAREAPSGESPDRPGCRFVFRQRCGLEDSIHPGHRRGGESSRIRSICASNSPRRAFTAVIMSYVAIGFFVSLESVTGCSSLNDVGLQYKKVIVR